MPTLDQWALVSKFSVFLNLIEELILLHVGFHFMTNLVEDETQLVDVLLFVDFSVWVLQGLGSSNKVGLDFRSHVRLCSSDGWKSWNDGCYGLRIRAPTKYWRIWASFWFLLRAWFTLRIPPVQHVVILTIEWALAEHGGQTEVSYLSNGIVSTSLVDQYIFWLQISMQDIILMDLGHTVDYLRKYFKVMLSIDNTNFGILLVLAWLNEIEAQFHISFI